MHIYLIRHTEYVNPENVFAFLLPFHLSQEGRKKAEDIGTWFAKKGLVQLPIYTSPLVRAVQTAELIAAKTDSFVSIDTRLVEVACPALEGKKQPTQSWILEEEDPSRETRQQVLDRMLAIFNEKVHEGKDCILVSHGEGLAMLSYYFQQKPLPRYLWSDENKPNITKRGEGIAIEIQENKSPVLTPLRDFST